ncbi:hypothetical protein bcgnr5390_61690 [Bacillus luti]|nr:hypothetical protein BC2903_31130 [Bacillus cereus]
MKKKALFVMGAAAILTLSACSDELPKSITSTKETDESKNKKEATETSSSKSGFNVLEQQKKFGGGTFNIDNTKDNVGGIDVTELKDGIFLTVKNINDYKFIIGDKKKWKKKINLDYYHNSKEVKGNKTFVEKDEKMYIREYSFRDETGEMKTSNGIQLPEQDIIQPIKTSEGSGLIVQDLKADTIKIYIDNKVVGEFKDDKDVFTTNNDSPEEFSCYFDVKNQILYFTDSKADRSYVYQIDVKTGKPLFKDGKLKYIKSTHEVNILGDKKGNVFLMEINDNVTIAAYDKNLNPLTEKFTVPVKNPDLSTFTVANDELHFYSAYNYELEPMLELTRVSIPALGKK